MTVESLLLQPKTLETVQAIELFLSVSESDKDKENARCFLLDIYTSHKEYIKASNLAFNILESMKYKENNPNYDPTLKLLIQSLIEQSRYEDALSYILIRKKTLPILKQYESLLDRIYLEKHRGGDYENYLREVLNEPLPDAIKEQLQTEQLEKFVNAGDYDLAMALINQMRLRLLPVDLALKVELIELDILLKSAHFQKILDLLENRTEKVFYVYQLAALVGLKKTHQAQIFEVEHEALFETLPIEDQKAIFLLLIDLYTTLKDKLSLDNYQKKLKALKKSEPKKEEVVLKVEPPIIEKTEPLPIVSEPVKPKDKLSESIQIEKITALIRYQNSLNEDIEPREKLRLLLTEASKMVSISEIVIFTRPNQIKHFKKERLYDKTIEAEDYMKSILYAVDQQQEDIIVDRDIIRWPLDILTLKPYKEVVKRLYAYSIHLGVILYYQETDEEALFYDDYLKLLSLLIENHLMALYKATDKFNFKVAFQTILDQTKLPLKLIYNDQYYLNNASETLFNLPKNKDLVQFIKALDGETQIKYRNLIQSLLKKEKTQEDIIYPYQDYFLKESFESIPYKNQLLLFSTITDIKDQLKADETIQNESRLDPFYKALNRKALHEDLANYLKEKVTLVLLDLVGLSDIESLYGYDQAILYMKEFLSLLQNEGNCYIINNHQVVLFYPFNDIRTTDKKLKGLLDTLKTETSNSLHQQTFISYAGVIRYPINTTETNLDKLLNYLNLALDKALKKKYLGYYQYFDFSDYQDEQFDLELIKAMDEGITHHTLEIAYYPIIHLLSNKVYSYQVERYLPNLNVSSDYFEIIARKRSMLDRLDKYTLLKAFNYLSNLSKKMNKYIRLSIQIDETTFKQKDFSAYLIGLFKTYEIPYSVIMLTIKGHLRDADFYKVKELQTLGVMVSTTELSQIRYNFNFIYLKDIQKMDDIRILDFVLMLKTFADNHQLGLIFYGLDEALKRKFKAYNPVYILENKWITHEEIEKRMLEHE